MIYSMTGYGKAFEQLPTKKITIEIRTLNSKNLDIHMRVPSLYKEKELEMRNIVAKELERGKIEVYLTIESTGEETRVNINTPVVESYMEQLRAISPSAQDTELLQMAVRLPESLKTVSEDLNPEEWKTIREILLQALKNTKEFRAQEGKKLGDDFTERIGNIRSLLNDITPFEQERIQTVKERLQNNLNDLKVEVDEQRFAQEVVYYLEKMDINEEKVRLSAHLDYFEETLNSQENSGRKLGFIAQEIGREINTMGSKSSQSDMQQIVVKMKDELEKIKEQVLNIL